MTRFMHNHLRHRFPPPILHIDAIMTKVLSCAVVFANAVVSTFSTKKKGWPVDLHNFWRFDPNDGVFHNDDVLFFASFRPDLRRSDVQH